MSSKGLDFLIKEEGLKLKAYKCSAGIWTIGVGCTYYEDGSKIKPGDTITKDRAISLFKNLLRSYELAVYSVTRDDINQNQFDAMVSLCFNIGTHGFKNSLVVKRVNINPKATNIRGAFIAWQNSTVNGKKKPILLQRRLREVNLYYS